jgi:hypothetical protein
VLRLVSARRGSKAAAEGSGVGVGASCGLSSAWTSISTTSKRTSALPAGEWRDRHASPSAAETRANGASSSVDTLGSSRTSSANTQRNRHDTRARSNVPLVRVRSTRPDVSDDSAPKRTPSTQPSSDDEPASALSTHDDQVDH